MTFLCLCIEVTCVVVNIGALEQMFPASVNIGQEKIGYEVWPWSITMLEEM